MEPSILIGCGLAICLAIGTLFASYRSQKKRRLLEALPTSATQGVFIGLVELKGTAESSAPLTTFLAEIAAVHYRWSVSEQWERWETEYYTDRDGKRRSRRVRKSGWSTVASGGDSQPFYLRDETGVVLVRPEGAEVRGISVFNQYCGMGNPLYFQKGQPVVSQTRPASATSTRRRSSSTRNSTSSVGHRNARTSSRPRSPCTKPPPSSSSLRKPSGKFASGWGHRRSCGGCSGPAAAAGVGAVFGQEIGAVVGGLCYLAVAACSRLILIYNSMIDTRNRLRQGFSQIDIQLRRRADLIPPLVAIVDAISKHEREVQSAIAKLRAESTATAPGKPGEDPRALAPRLRIVIEKYPQLKTDTHFLKLQEQLVETEQRLALARGYFNDIATEWNNRVEQFPDSILAKLFRFRHQALFEAIDFERAPVEVEFAE